MITLNKDEQVKANQLNEGKTFKLLKNYLYLRLKFKVKIQGVFFIGLIFKIYNPCCVTKAN